MKKRYLISILFFVVYSLLVIGISYGASDDYLVLAPLALFICFQGCSTSGIIFLILINSLIFASIILFVSWLIAKSRDKKSFRNTLKITPV